MRVGRRRTKDKHLPRRVYLEFGRYWYKPKPQDVPLLGGKRRINVGTTETEIYEGLRRIAAELSARKQTPATAQEEASAKEERRAKSSEQSPPPRTMGEAFDRYVIEVLPTLAPRTQSDYSEYLKRLRPILDPWEPRELTAGDIFDLRAALARKSGNTQANRHIAFISAVMREAIGWHALEHNPCRELKRLPEPARDRYVWDHEFAGVYGIASPMMQGTMDLAVITGQREDDLLKLPYEDPTVYTDEGIVFRPSKTRRRHPRHGKIVETGKIVIVKWLSEAEEEAGIPREQSELWKVVERLRKLGPQPIGNVVPIRPRKTLICTLDGQPYTGSGFRSNWARLMQTALHGRKLKNGRVILEPVLKEPFTFNDLRAKSATDDDFEEAHNRLAHSDRKTTQRVYVRKPRRARAGRKVSA